VLLNNIPKKLFENQRLSASAGICWSRDDRTWQRIHDTLRAKLCHRDGRHPHVTASGVDSQTVETGVTPDGIRGFDDGKLTTGRKRNIFGGRVGWPTRYA
jgi:hypothetical protein